MGSIKLGSFGFVFLAVSGYQLAINSCGEIAYSILLSLRIGFVCHKKSSGQGASGCKNTGIQECGILPDGCFTG